MINSAHFLDQADLPPTTERPDFTPSSPYARRQFATASSAQPDLIFDEVLIQKYNHLSPLYTSYPSVSELKPIAEGKELDILKLREANTPLSLYLHTPMYPDFRYGSNKSISVIKDNHALEDYLDYLKREIKLKRNLLAAPEPNRKPLIKQLSFDVGTFSVLKEEELKELWLFLQTQFEFDVPANQGGSGEYSIEVDPLKLSATRLATLRSLGFNHIILKVQDLETTVQNTVNTAQSEPVLQSMVDEARRLNYDSIKIEIVYSLSDQTPESLVETVEHVIAMNPDRLSIIDYEQPFDQVESQRPLKDQFIPSPSQNLSLFKQIIEALTEAGYHYIGIDLFAKSEDPLAIAQREGKLYRNFQGYTIHGDCDLIGFGVSAISQINSTLYSSKGASASHILQNDTTLEGYKRDVIKSQLPAAKHIKTTIRDRLRGYVIMHLLCHNYIDFKDVNQHFGIDAITYFIDDIQKLGDMQRDRVVDMDAAGIRILPKGRLLSRNVAMVFDSYINQ